MDRRGGITLDYTRLDYTYLGENGTAVKAQLLQRWAQRMSVAINRSTMEELWFRVVEIRRTGRVGDDALTGVDIRFVECQGLAES